MNVSTCTPAHFGSMKLFLSRTCEYIFVFKHIIHATPFFFFVVPSHIYLLRVSFNTKLQNMFNNKLRRLGQQSGGLGGGGGFGGGANKQSGGTPR